jgi:Flp pilus assembly protein TadG
MSLLKKFAKDIRGNTAIIFALAIVPMVLAAGASIDWVRANHTQTILQGAADAAAIAGASSGETSHAALEKIVADYVNANGVPEALTSITNVESNMDEHNGKFSVTIKGKIKTSLMHIAGISEMELGAFSEVGMGNRAMEVVLVLDNTGSMNASNRLPALKDASKQLVAELLKKQEDNYIRIGIVPFSEYVNVGKPNRNASWISVPADTTSTTNSCWDTYPNATKSNCRMESGTWSNDGVVTPYTNEVCDWDYGSPVQQCGPSTATMTWDGCVGSRSVTEDTVIGNLNIRYPGVQNVSCPAPLMPLDDDQDDINDAIDAMVGTGNTYIPSGLLWGWNVLDADDPIGEAKSSGWMKSHGGVKAIVLMTDGDNTLQPSYPYHTSNGGIAGPANAKVTELCNNIKGEDITIYTVSLMVTDPVSKGMLVDCATDGTKAFEADDPSALSQAFKHITESLIAMRFVK